MVTVNVILKRVYHATFVFCHPDRSGILLPRSGGINAKRFAFAFREGNRCERRTLKGVCDVRIQQ